MPKRKTIAVDIDDVLAASAQGFADFSNKHWGTSITADDYREEWALVRNIPVEEAVRRSVVFHEAGGHGGYSHIPEAVEALGYLADRYDLVAVTSRSGVVKSITDEWLSRYFNGLFKDVRYVGMWDRKASIEHKLRATKTEVCRELSAAYLIDDQLKHCESAASAGIKALLFGDYPWNRTDVLLPDITRVRNWQAVLDYFDASGDYAVGVGNPL